MPSAENRHECSRNAIKHYEKTISTMQSLSSMLTNTSDSMKY